MSYILDALRKSESERRQGKVPELGHQVQLIHKPRKTSLPVLAWVGLALVLNAAVLAYVVWPSAGAEILTGQSSTDETSTSETSASEVPAIEPASPTKQDKASEIVAEKNEPGPQLPSKSETETADTEAVENPAVGQPATEVSQGGKSEVVAGDEKPTIIVPSARKVESFTATDSTLDPSTLRHLVEMPLAYQKSIPDLVFNSHIYASDPSSRRVMINGHYLRTGEMFSGIRVEQITEEGVVLSKDGQRFRVGSVRNWVSPD